MKNERIIGSRQYLFCPYFYQNPNETALSIGKHAPIPNQTAVKNPKINKFLDIKSDAKIK